MSAYSLLQQQLDPNVEGKISRDQYLRVMRHYFTLHDATTKPPLQQDPAASTPRSSFSDRPQLTKKDQISEPEIVSESDAATDDCYHHTGNNPVPVAARGPPSSVGQATRRDDVERECDWQLEYDQLLAQKTNDDVLVQGVKVASLMADFRFAAEQIVEEIVHDIALNDDDRSLPVLPLDDDQFLATDYNNHLHFLRQQVMKFNLRGLIVYVTNEPMLHHVFGDQVRAARVLQRAIDESQATSLQLPLQCVVDYLGFRGLVVAPPSPHSGRVLSSKLLSSCSKSTQQHIRADLEQIFTHVGLHADSLGSTRDQHEDRLPPFVGAATGVATTADRSNGVHWLHNVFDTLPIDALGGEVVSPRCLRPEFVGQVSGQIPLHSQAFSEPTESMLPFNHHVILQQAAFSAGEYLKNVAIPSLVDTVEQNCTQIYDSSTLTAAMHRAGINMRYLGMCYELASSKHIKRLFLSEMIARACKQELRLSLHDELANGSAKVRRVGAEHLHTSNDDDIHASADQAGDVEPVAERDAAKIIVLETVSRVVVEFFNLVFGLGSTDSKLFWADHIIPRVVAHFALSSSEIAQCEALGSLVNSGAIHMPQIFQALLHHSNVEMADLDYDFTCQLPFEESAFVGIQPRSKLLCRTTTRCVGAFETVDQLIDLGQLEEALETIQAQIGVVGASLCSNDEPTLTQLLIAAAELCLRLEKIESAEKFTSLALEASPNRSAVYAIGVLAWLKVKNAQSESVDQLMQIFTLSLDAVGWHLGAAHPILCEFHLTMMAISRARGDQVVAFKLYAEAASLMKDCYGRASVAYADLRREQGKALIEANRIEESTSVLDEAFSIYEQLASEMTIDDPAVIVELKQHAASCLFSIADLQAAPSSVSGFETAFSTAVRAYQTRIGALPAQHPDILGSLLQLGRLCVSLEDSYRALEYYQAALVQLKALLTEEIISEVTKVTHIILDLRIRSLPAEKKIIINGTKKRLADHIRAFSLCLNDQEESLAREEPRSSPALQLIRLVTRELLVQDPVDYLDELVDKANEEHKLLRRDRFSDGTLRGGSAAEDPGSASVPTAAINASRFASFAMGQPLHHPQAGTNATTSSESSPALTKSTGEFTHSGRLAAVLFLASLPDDDDY